VSDYTSTPDAAEAAAWCDTYPEPADRPSKADLAEEAEWWRHFKARTDLGTEPGWGPEAEQRVRDVLRAAVAEVTCQGCGQRGHDNTCSHGKNICEGCWPDRCWGCLADADEAHYDEEER
jgi:hypothetical protein